MAKKRTKRQKAIIRRRVFVISCLAVFAAICVGLVAVVRNIVDGWDKVTEKKPETVASEPEEIKLVSTATVVNTGDILVHSPVLAGAKMPDGSYDFTDFFKEAKPYFEAENVNLATINLELTTGSTEAGAYQGYPAFNTPDSILDAIQNYGISMVTTANNHCYDTGLFGLKRTVQQLKAKGIEFIGTKEVPEDHTYIVKDVNGVKIGMVNYTYENVCENPDRKSINGNIISAEANALINSFNYDRIDNFYTEAQSVIESMKKDGAEAIVFYMHWGEEYQLTQNVWQETIAQKLCNMGVDVIVGGHPHVVQPVKLLTSEDSEHTTACVYSMGNSISNQRQEIMAPECTTGHTEDGMLFYYSFQKYSDGTVKLSAIDLIPTWVNKYPGKSGSIYTMYPLENPNDGAEKYGLSGSAATKSAASYERTRQIVGAGLAEVQQYLGCNVRFPQ